MRVPEIKRCERCYKPISFLDSADWYSHLRVKYCDECKAIVEKEQAAERFRRFKERKKEANRVLESRLKELELENAILREKLKALWGEKNYDTGDHRSGDL